MVWSRSAVPSFAAVEGAHHCPHGVCVCVCMRVCAFYQWWLASGQTGVSLADGKLSLLSAGQAAAEPQGGNTKDILDWLSGSLDQIPTAFSENIIKKQINSVNQTLKKKKSVLFSFALYVSEAGFYRTTPERLRCSTDAQNWPDVWIRRENVKLFPGSDQTFSQHVKAKSWWRRTPHMCRCDKQAVTMATATVVWNNLGPLRFQTAAPRFSCCFVQRYKTKQTDWSHLVETANQNLRFLPSDVPFRMLWTRNTLSCCCLEMTCVAASRQMSHTGDRFCFL